jgi:hypothetical protein
MTFTSSIMHDVDDARNQFLCVLVVDPSAALLQRRLGVCKKFLDNEAGEVPWEAECLRAHPLHRGGQGLAVR